jgi:hypothetical protein
MKRSHTIKIEDLQNSIEEGSIEEISQEQAKKINGGFFIGDVPKCPDWPRKCQCSPKSQCP